MIKILILFILNITNANVESSFTNPRPDLVIYNQDTLSMYSDWRDQYLIYPLMEDKKYKRKFENQIDTTCWASYCFIEYSAVWEIDNGHLYLNEIRSCCSDEKIDLKNFFKKREIKNERVKASWVNREISISEEYYALIYPWQYEDSEWFVVTINNGVVDKIEKEKW